MYWLNTPFWRIAVLVAELFAITVYFRRSKKWKDYRCTKPEER